jgi:hypothetical protein
MIIAYAFYAGTYFISMHFGEFIESVKTYYEIRQIFYKIYSFILV